MAVHGVDVDTDFVTFGSYVSEKRPTLASSPSAPASSAEVPIAEAEDGDTDFIAFGSHVSTEVSTASKARKKNERRAKARKKAFGARTAARDEAAESTEAPAPAPSTRPHLKKFLRTRNRRKFGRRRRSKNKHRGIRGWRGLGWRGKCGRRHLNRRSRAVRRKRSGDGIRYQQKFTFNVTGENYRRFRDQIRGGGRVVSFCILSSLRVFDVLTI